MMKVGIFPCFFLLAVFVFNLGADEPSGSSLEAVQLQPMPISVSLKCAYDILRGNEDFRGTYFVVPKVFVARTVEGKTRFAVLPRGNNKFLVHFALYFQRENEAVESRKKGKQILHGCDFEAVKTEINKRFGEDSDFHAWTIASLPISNAEIAIEGLETKKVLLGPDKTNLLDRGGNDLSVSMELTQDELDLLLWKLDKVGIQIISTMGFEASKTVGLVEVQVDGEAVATDLEAALSVGGKLPAFVGQADLKAAYSNSLKRQNVNMTVRGEDNFIQSAAEKLLERTMQGLGKDAFVTSLPPKRKAKEKNQREDVKPDPNDEDPQKNPNQEPDPDEPDPGQQPDRSQQEDQSDQEVERSNASGSRISPVKVKLDAVLKHLRSEQKTAIKIRKMGNPTRVYATVRSPLMTGKVSSFSEPTFRLPSAQLNNRTGHINPSAPNIDTGLLVKSGTKVTIIPGKKDIFRIKYTELMKEYFSLADLKALNEEGSVPFDSIWNKNNEYDLNLYEYPADNVSRPRAYRFRTQGWYNLHDWKFFVWGRIETCAESSLKETLPQASDSSVSVSFSKMPKVLTLEQLLKQYETSNGPLVVQKNPEGGVTIEAKKDLGRLYIQSSDKPISQFRWQIRYFEELWGTHFTGRALRTSSQSAANKGALLPLEMTDTEVVVLANGLMPDIQFDGDGDLE